MLTGLFAGSAFAHSFNVAVVLPAASPASAQQIRQGFMLATTEKDGHPDEESDGHLGGLDVYVSFIETANNIATGLNSGSGRGAIDIVVVFGSEDIQNSVENAIDGGKTTVVLPGTNPFSKKELPGVASFVAAYEKSYGGAPDADTAQGYNIARRIDVAVRDQAGVDDRARLRSSFDDTAQMMDW